MTVPFYINGVNKAIYLIDDQTISEPNTKQNTKQSTKICNRYGITVHVALKQSLGKNKQN
jgi:hypothetical protein